MKKFQVPQRQVRAAVRLHGGAERRGYLYTATSGPGGGPGRLSDRLNDASERFLAMSDEQRGCLLSKNHIVEIELDADQRDVELDAESELHQTRVRLDLAAGQTLEGVIPYTMPPDKERLLDFLNAAPRFIPLLGDEGLALVNIDYVTAVTNLED